MEHVSDMKLGEWAYVRSSNGDRNVVVTRLRTGATSLDGEWFAPVTELVSPVFGSFGEAEMWAISHCVRHETVPR